MSKLDHLVLPVTDLAVARERLTALGFTVAPDGVHPFGTANCCVYFEDGTFLEPLAVKDAALATAAIAAGNVFVARDRLFRDTVGAEGLSALVLTSDDARADHAEFERLRISGGPLLEFSRPFVDAAGASDEASFRLAFASDSQASGCYFFTCQRVRSPKVDRSALQRHPNGVVRPRTAVWAAKEPSGTARFWSDFLGQPPMVAQDKHLLFVTERGRYLIASDEYISATLGVEPDNLDVGMRARAIEFETTELDRLHQLLDANGVEHHVRPETTIVPPAPGQGVTFIFGRQS